MGVAYNIRRGFGVGLPVPETSFEKLGPMPIVLRVYYHIIIIIIMIVILHNDTPATIIVHKWKGFLG